MTAAAKSPVVTKHDIVSAVAAATGLKKSQAEQAYDTVLNVIKDKLTEGLDVRLSGVGSLKTAIRPASKSRNPRTGEEFDVPERRVVRFSVSKELKDAVAAS